MIVGTVDNGRVCHIEFPFYSGRAGARVIGDNMEIGYFGAPPPVKNPVLDGSVDGTAVRIVGHKVTDMAGTANAQMSATKAVTLTVRPLETEG
ncbi:hypothetical protein [Sphingobium sp. BS19]|uniref:hypothetical protein n=1 Tax=Sphingobium sp. BS19 TaxID=3018973 RepID=UPI0022EE7EDA|nr:hypothetical protein [Sphingobium sp. BS19]GLI99132.1 hypothetical protein Sbs19_29500 [Sphingobium sp. BS19]